MQFFNISSVCVALALQLQHTDVLMKRVWLQEGLALIWGCLHLYWVNHGPTTYIKKKAFTKGMFQLFWIGVYNVWVKVLKMKIAKMKAPKAEKSWPLVPVIGQTPKALCPPFPTMHLQWHFSSISGTNPVIRVNADNVHLCKPQTCCNFMFLQVHFSFLVKFRYKTIV